MRRQILPAILMVVVMTVLLGAVYPLVSTAVGQVAFHDKANGSLVQVDGRDVGSSLIGQNFTEPQYFHGRPSAAGDGYDGMSSSGSNLGPLNPELLDEVALRVAAYREQNGLSGDVAVPVDAVTASASGLDPHISLANAQLQTKRVAEARGLTEDQVRSKIDENTDRRTFGVLGDDGVNVVELNIALDRVS